MTGALALIVDLLVLGVLVGYAVSGYRRGFVLSLSSLVGFVAGALGGLWIVPRIERLVGVAPMAGSSAVAAESVLRLLLIVLFVFACANLGQWAGAKVGERLRGEVRTAGSRAVDSWAGALAVLVTTAFVVWFVAGAVRPAAPAPVAAALGRSAVLSGIDSLVPARVGGLLAGLRSEFAAQGFPQVFDALAREPITSVAAPSQELALSPAVAAAGRSVVRIEGEATGCRNLVEGTGWVLAPERVVTNAHVVAGTRMSQVTDVTGTTLSAQVVVFDPRRDLAVLVVPGLSAPALPLGGILAQGADAAILGFPLGGPYAVSPARVRGQLVATGRDIYGQGAVTRDIYSVRAVVQPGNSGGPLLDDRGQVAGVVFARSLDDAATGYAMTVAEVAGDLDQGRVSNAPQDTGPCLNS